MNNRDKPAFPPNDAGIIGVNTADDYDFCGLTKREYFAAIALQGILSHPENIRAITKAGLEGGIYNGNPISECAVNHADALLKALEYDDAV